MAGLKSSDQPRGAALLPNLGRSPVALLAVATLLCLARFIDKPVHIDDPLFLWAAQQILHDPLDFYGFDVNWVGIVKPMSQVTQNPPLACYVIAGAALLFGFNEILLHATFFLFAIGAVIGTCVLARRMCERPLIAAIITLITPVFLVSATTLMCDVMLVCFWVWSVWLWDRGLRLSSAANLLGACFLIAGATMTKYFGISLLPLLAAYSMTFPGRKKLWALLLLAPAAAPVAYQLYTEHLYGEGLLWRAANFAGAARAAQDVRADVRMLVAASFLGGCMLPTLALAPLAWSRRGLAAGAGLLLALLGLLAALRAGHAPGLESHLELSHMLQMALWATVGLGLLIAAAIELLQSRDRMSLLLAMWIGGTFVFAAMVNWSVNGRTILPIAPAAGILLARRLSKRERPVSMPGLATSLGLSAAASYMITWADYSLAHAARDAAIQIHRDFDDGEHTLWFQGHWGFQYYMQNLGARPVDLSGQRFQRGDVLVIPFNNTGTRPLDHELIINLAILEFPTFTWVSTMNHSAGAGFYSDVWGPLPFAIGGTSESYRIQGFMGNLAPEATPAR